MNRILVLGSSGAGKSTFARGLGAALDIEVIHLDSYFWEPNWQATPDELWETKLRALLMRPAWVMDGNYLSSLELRLEYADTLVFIDYNRLVCLWRCIKRFAAYRGENQPELAPGCYEKIDWEFFKWIWDYPRDKRPRVMEVLDRYADSVQIIHLKGDREVRAFINAGGAGLMDR
jgi:adenylate kinase family enzyme